MPLTHSRANLLLLLTAIIWGLAFVAQRAGMEHIGPFTYNGIRFGLGSLSLIPLLLYTEKRRQRTGADKRTMIIGCAMAGGVLFCGASLQQAGLVYTMAGKAGFITGLYVVIVPILGLFIKQKTGLGMWVGAVIAAWGMYLLSVTEALTIATGDLLVLLGAVFWAIHVLIISWLSPKMNPIKIAVVQFAACSILSLLTAVVVEEIVWQGIKNAAIPILYGGLMSVGIAYTLQVVGQQKAHPAHASIILSLEAAFAAIGGGLLLGEQLSMRGLTGCALMFAGMLISQLWDHGSFRLKMALGSPKRT